MTAVVAALLAALCFGAASVLQHDAACVPSGPHGSVPPGLPVRLLGRPRWLLGTAAGAGGLGLQALALHAGRVVVVAPLLTTGLVFALLLGTAVGRPPSRAQWLAAVAAVAGLGLFLAAARPAAGTATGHGPALGVGTSGALALCALAYALTRRPGAPHRALLLGAAAGTGFGLSAVLLKQVVGTPLDHLPMTWAPYALVVLGLTAVALAQDAFQSGSLVDSLPAMTVLEPVAAVAVGALGFSESLAGSPLARIGEAAGLALVALAVARLAALQARGQSGPAGDPPAVGRAPGRRHGRPAAPDLGGGPTRRPGPGGAAGAECAEPADRAQNRGGSV